MHTTNSPAHQLAVQHMRGLSRVCTLVLFILLWHVSFHYWHMTSAASKTDTSSPYMLGVIFKFTGFLLYRKMECRFIFIGHKRSWGVHIRKYVKFPSLLLTMYLCRLNCGACKTCPNANLCFSVVRCYSSLREVPLVWFEPTTSGACCQHLTNYTTGAN